MKLINLYITSNEGDEPFVVQLRSTVAAMALNRETDPIDMC